ncbi:MAG: Zn-dependent oligopeptidase [Elusimicrobia bacterium]|nr:Zn-dependent oligopeptidase [Elusimicrobiota bacterium]
MKFLKNPLATAVLLLTTHLQAAVAPPSSWLNFDLTPQQIKDACKAAKDKSEEGLKKIAAVAANDKDFENTVLAFENVVQEYSDATTGPGFLNYVSMDKGVRDASHECETDAGQYGVDVYTKEDVYHAIKSVADAKPALGGVDSKLMNKILLEFERNGLGADAQKRAKIKSLKKKLIDLELQFSKNLNEYEDHLEVAANELEGMPEDFIVRLATTADGKYKVTLDYPDYFPFMENAKNAEARRRLEYKYNNRGSTTNVRLMEEAITLRHDIARLLGFKTHAHYVMADRMAENPENAEAFLERVGRKLKPKGLAELKERLDLKAKDTQGPDAGIFHYWDYRYYNNQLKILKYDVDQEKIKEYFPFDLVLNGMLDIYQKLLGLQFQEMNDAALWHPDVRLFKVMDAESGNLIGYFYMDLFPRDNKYKHAAAFTLVQGRQLPDGSYQRPVAAIVANFNKPTADRPSLFKHDEVETFFHEFGHIMHQVVTTAKYGRFSGTNVSRDFVEAPSQIFENWVWDKDILKKISGHYLDKSKKLPDDLLDRMIMAKNMDSGLRYLRQTFFASVDLKYHAGRKADTTAVYEKLQKEISLVPMTKGTHPEAGFGHLMGGYDAGYYGYMWSEVYAADMFSRFEKEGVLNPETGRQYRKLILEPGRSYDEMGQLKKFLGREPNEDAFLKSIGLYN